MPYFGFNFRDTAGFVTDGTGETYVSGENDLYPTTRASQTFGWNSFQDLRRDRSNSVDRRLAGVNQRANGTQAFWRLDITAGTYDVDIALGDENSSQGYQYLQLKDTSSVLLTIDKSSGSSNDQFYDATGTIYSGANWPGSNTKVRVTFATTICYVYIGTSSPQSGSSTLAHIGFTPVVSSIYVPSVDTQIFRRVVMIGG